jgi:deoxyribonuclease V
MPDRPCDVFAAVDVDYPAGGGARAAAVYAPEPTFAELTAERVVILDSVAPYRPGAFYERELPAIRAVLSGPVGLLIVDGYVDLDPDGRPGLGAHVHRELGVAVVGVAKTPFRPATHAVPVLRGGSTRPLYVTAAGLSTVDAAALVRSMAGGHRLPAALKRVDALARGRA